MNRRAWAIAAVALCIVTAAVSVSGGATLLVVTDDAGNELATFPVEEGDEVTLEYTHSVERTLVTDVYRISNGALVSDRMLFSSFGAGLPSEADVERTGDRFVYYPPEQRHEQLSVSTGPIADHDLVVDGDRHDLAGMADNGTIQLRIDSQSRPAYVTQSS